MGLKEELLAIMELLIDNTAYAASWDSDLRAPSKNAVYDAYDRIISPTLFSGYNGFVAIDAWGTNYYVAFSDTNAYVSASFYVKNGGTFAVLITHLGDGNNNGKTASGKLYASSDVSGGAVTWDLLNAVNADLPLGQNAILVFYTHATTITIAANSKVGIRWDKDDNAAAAATNMYIYGVYLVRQ